MAKVLVSESSLTAIADAIREKNGETTTYKPSEMAAAITAIEDGGSGVWDKAVYSDSIAVNDTVNSRAFYGLTGITSLASRCTSVGAYAFSYCSSLTSIDLPACTSVGAYAFSSCSSLTSIDLPACTGVGSDAFSYCSKLTSIILRSKTMCKATGTQSFSNSSLKIYVPSDLIDEYKAASYWSSHASRFASLEDYDAGTATTALDDGLTTEELIAEKQAEIAEATADGNTEMLKELTAELEALQGSTDTGIATGEEVSRPVAD